MADEEYQNKLWDLQRYVPFLENTIKRLKTETGKPREAQISKLQSLLVILTDTKKKLKYDALKKCEEVIFKLYEKVEKKSTVDISHKHMCRDPPETKIALDGPGSSSTMDDVAFSVARQKLNKQLDLTPASPSPPLEMMDIAPKPVVIPTEKVPVAVEQFFPTLPNEFKTQHPTFPNQTWVHTNPQIINWPTTVFNSVENMLHLAPPVQQPYFQPQNQTWQPNEPLYSRRTDLNPKPVDPKYNIWIPENRNFPAPKAQREIVDYSDNLSVPDSPRISETPKPVPPPKLGMELPKRVPESVEPKKELIKIVFPPKKESKPVAPLLTSLAKPPLTESDLQDLLSSSNSPKSGEDSPLVNEDMDLKSLEELKVKLCKELEKNKKDDKKPTKPTVSSTVCPVKPKSPRVIERVVKEQDNIFGNLLSSIDEQIMVKTKEQQKKIDKKESGKKDLTRNDLRHSIKKDEKHDKHDKHDKNREKDKDKCKESGKSREKDKKVEGKVAKDEEIKKESSKLKEDSKSRSKSKENKNDSHRSTSKSKTDKDEKHRRSSITKEKEQPKEDKPKTVDVKDSKKVAKQKLGSKQTENEDETNEIEENIQRIVFMKQTTVVSKPKVEENSQNVEVSKELLQKVEEILEKVVIPKQIAEYHNKMKVKKPEVVPIIDNIMKQLKDSVKGRKEENLCKFGDSVREMQVNMSKSDSNHSLSSDTSSKDEKVPSSGRLSDKYPHKRKPSIEKQEFTKEHFVAPKKPVSTEVLPLKLADPRLKNNTPRNISPERNYPRPEFQTDAFSFRNQFSGQILKDPLLIQSNHGNMNCPPSMEPFPPGNHPIFNCVPPTEQFPQGYNGNHQNMDPYANNISSMDQFCNNLDDFPNNMDQFAPSDQFPSNYDVDDRFPSNYNMQMNHVNQNLEQFWNRPNQEQFMNQQNQFENNFHNQRFVNFGNRSNLQFQDQNCSQYDLSQMNPIDFYDNEDKNQERRTQNVENDFNLQNNRAFRGRGVVRGSFIGRGQSRNIQWVNPMVREETNRNEDNHERGRYETRFEEPKDPRRSRFDEHRPARLNEDKNDSRLRYNEDKSVPRTRFSEDTDVRPRFTEETDTRARGNEEKAPRSRFVEDKDHKTRFNEGRKSRWDDVSEENSRKNRSTSQNDDTKRDDPRKSTKKEETSSKESKDAKEKKKEEIFSPLDSLYSKENKQIGKGYGFQKFKIPKIRKSIDENKEEAQVKKDADKPKESVETSKNNENIEEISEKTVEPVVEETVKVLESKKVEESHKVEDKKEEKKVEEDKEAKTSKEEPGNENTVKTEPDDKLDMFNKFMKHIFDTCDSSVLLQYLDKCGFALPQAKTKRIRRIIESDSESEEDEHKEEVKEQVVETVSETVEEIEEIKPKTPEKAPITEEVKLEGEIVETVGERIKNRRRKQLIYSSDSSPEKVVVANETFREKTPPKKETCEKKVAKYRRKNALELLQDDLREMFISEGVLTATGKRMCRMMKEHEEKELCTEMSPKKKPESSVATTTDEEDDLPLVRRKPHKITKKPKQIEEKLPLRKTRSSPRVVLEKINLPTAKESETSESEPEFIEPEPEIIKPSRRTRRFGSTEPVLLELNKFGAAKVVKPRKARKKQQIKETDEDSESIISEKSEIEIEPDIVEFNKFEAPKVVKTVKKGRKKQQTKETDEDSESVVSEKSEMEVEIIEKPVEKKKTGRQAARKKKVSDDNESVVSEKSETDEKPDKQLEKQELNVKTKKKISDDESIVSESQVETNTIETETEKKKLPIKKKKNNWAHGVIKRQPKCRQTKEKSSVSSLSSETSDRLSISESFTEEIEENLEEPGTEQSETEEYDFLKIDVLPDVNYFIDNGNKFDCKLCDFKGKFIVHHYRTRHFESEVMISRLSPEQAEKAQIESNLNKFEEITAVDELFHGKKRRTTYTCRFCALTVKQENAGIFFDHLCCHTGEYRYSCESCEFSAGNKKALSAHCHNSHQGMKRLNLIPNWDIPNFRLVFGYLCKACNFTQLLKQNVEKHVKLSHPGQNIAIIKINMSIKPVNLDDLNLNSEEETSEKTPEPVKEPNMTVFIESEDNSIREKVIEDERRKKMEEISSNIIPRRSTLQFVDQLKNKLQNALSNSLDDHEPSIDIINHPIEPLTKEKVEQNDEVEEINFDDAPEEIIPEELTLKIASTCSLAGIEHFETEPEETDKSLEDSEPTEHISDEEIDISNVESLLPTDSKQKGVLDTIQRLAAKLQEPKASASTENLAEEVEEEIINVGAIETRIKQNEELFVCLVPDCRFSTSCRISFVEHCSDIHQKLLVTCKLCENDSINFKPISMTALFSHITEKHSKINTEDVVQPPKIRFRRISGDLLSKPNNSDDETSKNDMSPLLEALNQPIIFESDIPLEIIEKPPGNIENPEEPLGFLQIKDVRTLTPEEENNLQTNIAKNSSVTTVTPTGKKVLQTKKILIPLKVLPKYLTMNRKSKELNLVKKTPTNLVKKTPTNFEKEILTCNKTKKIFTEMMKFPKIMDLYKCPIELCSFSTNEKAVFTTHFTNHRWCQITSCVYCLEGIPSNNLIHHIDKYHLHCTFQCGFCFYRSVTKNYVLIHQQSAHGFLYESLTPNFYNETPKYYIVPSGKGIPTVNANVFMVNSRLSMIQPYICKQSACDLKFLIADDFMVHLHICHKQFFECALCDRRNIFFVTAHDLIAHYIQHFIGRYQCRFCLFALTNITGMYHHYARKHPAMKPICYVRQFKNKNNQQNTVEDIMEIDMDNKMVFEKSVISTIDVENPPDLVPISTTTTSNEQITDQNVSSSSNEELKPTVSNLGTAEDPIQIPKSNKIIDVIDLSDDNPDIEGNKKEVVENEFLIEPLVTLKHRSVESKNAVENAVDPLSFESLEDFTVGTEVVPTEKPVEASETNAIEIETSEIDDMFDANEKELDGSELFKCGSTDCNFNSSKISDFKIHLFTCDIMRNNIGYKCYHCQENFSTVTELCDHIHIHGIRRFSCGVCDFKSALSRDIVKHMKSNHKIANSKFHPLDALKKDISKDTFIVKPIGKDWDGNLILPTVAISPQKAPKTTFGPEDIELLPRPPVYSSDIKCKLCNYATKVRSNMQRHLQQHIEEKAVPETAPINPVPCLEKNERMFDKMTNLAASSHSGRMGGKSGEKIDKNAKEDDKSHPGFIPANKRFVCGASNCNYLTHGDTMLRHHLTALHADEITYKCPHCQIDVPCEIDGIDIDQILFHLKMHDLHLYKCPNCNFLHYQKHKIERHFTELHPDSDKHIIIIRELDNSANIDDSRPSLPISFSETVDEFKPWRCGFCSYKSTTRPDIQSHASVTHNIKSQFKCGLCNFRCSAKTNYNAHYKKNHPKDEINIISVFYKVSEDEQPKLSSQEVLVEKPSFDTTPLWVKNKSGVKHIRGILLEETRSPKRSPKIIEKLSEIKNTETTKSIDDITKNLFEDLTQAKVTRKTNKTTEKSLDFTPKYPSNYGSPDDNFYVCPTCEKFKTTSVKDFIAHLHEEMNYFRCVCNICDFRFVDISQAKLHWSENHGTEEAEEKITPLTPDGKVENWVENCVRHQHTNMKTQTNSDVDDVESLANISPTKSVSADPDLEIDVDVIDEEIKVSKSPKKILKPQVNVGTATESNKSEVNVKSPAKLFCQHCGMVAKTKQTLKKHLKRHFSNLPVKCNHCEARFNCANSIVQHHRAKHKNLVVSYTTQSHAPTFRPLKRKRRQNDDNPTPAKIMAKEDIKIETCLDKSVDSSENIEETSEKDEIVARKQFEGPEVETIFVCFHCPRKSDDLETVRLHFIGSHEKVHKGSFKYKKVTIDKNKKTQYKCNYCSFVGHPDGLKQHHLDNHSNKTWVCQKAVKYKCNNCCLIFAKINPLRKHFNKFHPKENLCYQTILEDDENDCLDTTEIVEESLDIKPVVKFIKCEYCLDCFETQDQLLSHHNLLHSHLELIFESELKKYKCPQCYHTSNSYPAMRDHLRSHNKPFSCFHCSLFFSYPNQLKSHHLKEHRLLPLKDIKEQPEIRKQMDLLREKMLYLGPDGQYNTKNKTLKRSQTENTDEPPNKVFLVEESAPKMNVARKSTSLPANFKNVAKKSTSNRPKIPEGFSFYGSKPVDISCYKNVMSEINIMGKTLPINVVAMSHVLNLCPKVVVTDFKKQSSPDL